jgi:hypothetical protein
LTVILVDTAPELGWWTGSGGRCADGDAAFDSAATDSAALRASAGRSRVVELIDSDDEIDAIRLEGIMPAPESSPSPTGRVSAIRPSMR